MRLRIFGVRHHGPGCARSLLAALGAYSPDAVLIEGPPDANDVLPLAASEGMQPPVAIVIYPPDRPQEAVFYPFAEFSPEWQALQFALRKQISARFIDLPQSHELAIVRDELERTEQLPATERENGEPIDPAHSREANEPEQEAAVLAHQEPVVAFEDDPVGALSLAAGYSDRELWWEHQIEQRQDPAGLFDGIMEAMVAMRAQPAPDAKQQAHMLRADRRRHNELREAYMRQQLRQARREKLERIAVVCGAWHAPALAELGSATDDAELLRGLPKLKVAATWAPWTFTRLAARSGYGAGITSPGWYDHLWHYPNGSATRWAARAARLLRENGIDASAASVIETVRLAEALAAMRNLPMAGLHELTEAIFTVLCHSEPARLALVRDKLEVGTRLGRVPEEVAAVPLARDLEAQQKRLRLAPTTEIKTLDLDLRKENDRARSALLHRLNLLRIPWGQPVEHHSQTGTFHEVWRLQWQVEFVVDLIDVSVWGNTVEAAATNSAISKADTASTVGELTALLDQAILAELPTAVNRTLARLDDVGAVGADIRHLMQGLPPLARVIRYGDVRQTPTDRLRPVIGNFLERILVGLPGACASLDDEAAQHMAEGIGSVQASLNLLNDRERQTEFHEVLRRLMRDDSIHGLVRGWSCRLLLEARALADDELLSQASLALSSAAEPADAGAWIEGLLRGSGMVLLHEDALWTALDAWLCALSEDVFVELLPVLRRAVSGFQSPERRAMGEKVKQLGQAAAARRGRVAAKSEGAIDQERARLVIPVLAHILGVEPPRSEHDD
jgi:hypothetical protein